MGLLTQRQWVRCSKLKNYCPAYRKEFKLLFRILRSKNCVFYLSMFCRWDGGWEWATLLLFFLPFLTFTFSFILFHSCPSLLLSSHFFLSLPSRHAYQLSSPRWECPFSSTSKTTPPLRQLSFSWNFSQSSFRWSKVSLAKGGTGHQGQQKWITIIFSKLSDLLGQNGDSRAAQRSASHNVGKFAFSSSSEKLFNQRYHHPWISSLTGILANISTLTLILLISWAKLTTTSSTSTTSSAPQKHVTRPERQVSESSEEEVRGDLILSSHKIVCSNCFKFSDEQFFM